MKRGDRLTPLGFLGKEGIYAFLSLRRRGEGNKFSSEGGLCPPHSGVSFYIDRTQVAELRGGMDATGEVPKEDLLQLRLKLYGGFSRISHTSEVFILTVSVSVQTVFGGFFKGQNPDTILKMALPWNLLEEKEWIILRDLYALGPDCAKFLSRRLGLNLEDTMKRLKPLENLGFLKRVKGYKLTREARLYLTRIFFEDRGGHL